MRKLSNIHVDHAIKAIKLIAILINGVFKIWKYAYLRIGISLNVICKKILLVAFLSNSSMAQLASVNRVENLHERNSQEQSKKCTYDLVRHRKALDKVLKTQRYKRIKLQANTNQTKILIGSEEFDTVLYWRGECHQSISVYADHNDRWELRDIFLVNPSSFAIYFLDSNGEYTRLTRK